MPNKLVRSKCLFYALSTLHLLFRFSSIFVSTLNYHRFNNICEFFFLLLIKREEFKVNTLIEDNKVCCATTLCRPGINFCEPKWPTWCSTKILISIFVDLNFDQNFKFIFVNLNVQRLLQHYFFTLISLTIELLFKNRLTHFAILI